MITDTPHIGFDRFISLEWAAAALRVRAGFSSQDDFKACISEAGLSPAAKKKTITVLNRLWLLPLPDLDEFASRGVAIFRKEPDVSVAALTWGMAITTYPFFGQVAEIIGRLTSLHGDCSSADVHRRMAEKYGEREGTRRMTNMVIQSQQDWGCLARYDNKRRIRREPRISVTSTAAIEWIIEACLRYYRRPIPVETIPSAPLLFPIDFGAPMATIVAGSGHLELRQQGSMSSMISLRSAG